MPPVPISDEKSQSGKQSANKRHAGPPTPSPSIRACSSYPALPSLSGCTLLIVVLGLLCFAPNAHASNTVIFLTSTSTNTWTVPSDWNSASNTIEAIGGGGGGGISGPYQAGSGGGGGAYAKSSNVTLTAGGSVTVKVGIGGTGSTGSGVGGGGGDTYLCNSTSNCAAIIDPAVQVGAKGGAGGKDDGNGPGIGGASSTSVGTTIRYAGGSGGAAGTNYDSASSGGGGAGGPKGNGGAGGADSPSALAGGGGGGNGGGSAGQNASSSPGTGGNNFSGTGGGAIATSSPWAGANGSLGGGGGGMGGGGSVVCVSTSTTNGTGGAGNEFNASHGSGGGGGGGCGRNGGVGGLYGGGGGGSGGTGVTNGPNGAQGIIVITYTPASSPGPVITLATSTAITSSTATVTWTTDLSADSLVNYGLTAGYGSVVSSTATSTSHSLNLSGLSPGTTYHFQAQSTANGVAATSSDQTFLTLQAKLSVTTSTSLSFSAAHGSTATSSQLVTITNTGTASSTLNWSVTSTQTWLTFSPASSSLALNASTSVSFIANPTGLSVGTYNATATIADPNASSSPQTIPVTLTINTTGVSVSLTSPANGATVTSTVSVTASPTSTVGIASVQFILDGSPLGSAVTSSPYTISWNTASSSDGSHILTASTTDTNSNIATSSQISITVDNTPPVRSNGSPSGSPSWDTTSETLSLTTNETSTCKYSTAAGASFASMTTFATTMATFHQTPISGLSSGQSYYYYVKCEDSWGNINPDDYLISFAVGGVPISAGSGGPTVSQFTLVTITSPAPNAMLSGIITLSASVSSPATIQSLQFNVDGAPIGQKLSASPYIISLDTSALSPGTHSITASAENAFGETAISSPVTVTVASGTGAGTTTPGTSSLTDLQNQITQLTALLQALIAQAQSKGISVHFLVPLVSSGPRIFTRNLSLWATGADVTALQQFLIGHDTGPAAQKLKTNGTTRTFGLLTYAALKEYQAQVRLPATGYFGPMTRAYLNSH